MTNCSLRGLPRLPYKRDSSGSGQGSDLYSEIVCMVCILHWDCMCLIYCKCVAELLNFIG